MKHVKTTVNRLDTYRVQQDGCRVKLNQNESPYDMPVSMKRTISEELISAHWNRYPRRGAPDLVAAISEYTGVSGGIVLGNGSNELIQTLFAATIEAGDHILTVTPGFSLYPRLARIFGAGVRRVPLTETYEFDPRRIISRGRGAKLIFLATPNNPTGTSLNSEEITGILENCRGLVVADEAYFEFSGQTAVDLLQKHRHLVILRTFSKAFGLAGLRAGYLMCEPSLALQLEKVQMPFSLGVFQQTAARILLEKRSIVERRVARIVAERRRLHMEMDKIPGVIAVPSQANFIFFTVNAPSVGEVFETLRRNRVLVRLFVGKNGRGGVRVTVGRTAENNEFLQALRAAMGET